MGYEKGGVALPLQVFDETSPLKKVLLHRPGQELEQLTPAYLDQLLFDDIPYLAAAQQEHDCFAKVLREHGAQVVYLEDLVAEALAQDSAVRESFVQEFIDEAGRLANHYRAELTELLLGIENPKELVLKSMAGVIVSELPDVKRGPLSSLLAHEAQFVLAPIPNLYFTRDPFASIGPGVSMNHMYSETRNRETIYGRYLFRYHPDYRDAVPFFYQHNAPYSIEGGDILNLSRRVLAVGLSQRTSAEAVELLAHNLFTHPQAEVDTILALDIPNLRAYMHLDTVFTQVDRDKFTIHPAILEQLEVYRLHKRDDSGAISVEQERASLATVLQRELAIDNCTLINCGGKDRVASAREQWNDGANTLCLAPGLVVVYDRNKITNRILSEHGIEVLTVPSSELSRGRGGPRCMSMPLCRQ